MPRFVYKRRTALDFHLRLLDYAIGAETYEDVLNSLGAGIRAAIKRIESVGEEVAVDETEVIENMLGVAYVTCQVQITAVVQAAKSIPGHGLNVRNLHALDPRFDKNHSKVEVLWELANYFKHRDQWSRDTWTNPDKRTQRTLTVIKAAGLSVRPKTS